MGKFLNIKKTTKEIWFFFSYKYNKNYLERSYLIYNVIDSFKKNIPNAKIVCFVQEDSYTSLVVQLLQKNNVSIIIEKNILEMEIANSRFLYEYEYLKKKHKFF